MGSDPTELLGHAEVVAVGPVLADEVVLERSARIQLIVRDGRHADPSLQPVWDRVLQEGLTGMRLLGEHQLGTGRLRPGITIDEVTDLLWNCLAIDPLRASRDPLGMDHQPLQRVAHSL